MEKMLGPTGCLLVGTFFICLFIILSATAAGQPSDLPDLQKKLKEAQSSSFNQNHREWGARQAHSPGLTSYLESSKEKIILNESDSIEQVSDLTAMNAVKEREIICDTKQHGDPKAQGLVNFMEIGVTGQDKAKKIWPGESWEDNYIDQIVDNALNTSIKNDVKNSQIARRSAHLPSLGNNLNIDVSGISVSAINTMQGGSAVATSSIIIKPVQIIVCPSEVEEKLK